MARKWERMIEKNRKKINQQRVKGGQAKISYSGAPEMEKFLGRSLFLPILFIGVSFLFLFFFGNSEGNDTLYWVTVVSYFFLGMYFYFIKRPYLKVGKTQIATRKLGREKVVNASDIQKIIIQTGYIVIHIKGKRTQWIFSGFFNRFDLTAMANKLKELALQHSIPYEVEK